MLGRELESSALGSGEEFGIGERQESGYVPRNLPFYYIISLLQDHCLTVVVIAPDSRERRFRLSSRPRAL